MGFCHFKFPHVWVVVCNHLAGCCKNVSYAGPRHVVTLSISLRDAIAQFLSRCNTYGVDILVLCNTMVWWHNAWIFWLVVLKHPPVGWCNGWVRLTRVRETSVGHPVSFPRIWKSLGPYFRCGHLWLHHLWLRDRKRRYPRWWGHIAQTSCAQEEGMTLFKIAARSGISTILYHHHNGDSKHPMLFISNSLSLQISVIWE